MSGDLRAAVEGLPLLWQTETGEKLIRRSMVLALIPEGAVLVTEETLAAAVAATHWYHASSKDALHEAAAILHHLREGTE